MNDVIHADAPRSIQQHPNSSSAKRHFFFFPSDSKISSRSSGDSAAPLPRQRLLLPLLQKRHGIPVVPKLYPVIILSNASHSLPALKAAIPPDSVLYSVSSSPTGPSCRIWWDTTLLLLARQLSSRWNFLVERVAPYILKRYHRSARGVVERRRGGTWAE